MTELFQTFTHIEDGQAHQIVGRPDAATILERRRERADHISSLMNNGVSTAQIARDLGISRARVYQIAAFSDLAARLEPDGDLEPEPTPSLPQETDERPSWSYPDEITLRIVRDARAEMQKAGAE